jgi:hypothetical protein
VLRELRDTDAASDRSSVTGDINVFHRCRSCFQLLFMSHADAVQRLSRGCAWAGSNDAERRKYAARALDIGISPCVAAAACPHPGTAAAAAMQKHTQAVVTQTTTAQRQPSAGGTRPVRRPAPVSGRAGQTPRRQQQQLSRWQRMRHGSWRPQPRRCRSCGRIDSSWSASQRSATRCAPVSRPAGYIRVKQPSAVVLSSGAACAQSLGSTVHPRHSATGRPSQGRGPVLGGAYSVTHSWCAAGEKGSRGGATGAAGQRGAGAGGAAHHPGHQDAGPGGGAGARAGRPAARGAS